ncbi:MAG TPA: hypothetical protein VHM25_11655 [Polyangiaceae bacterium]|jgi:hypothetical protein|nr:hypothetical protein [Polyangiaceae bacterium]
MPPTTPYPTSPAITGSPRASEDDCADLRRVLENAQRSVYELRQSAERARKEHDHELATFFLRCTLGEESTVAEATELLNSRTRLSASEIPTSAAFAAGDGADDADVSPDSRRGKVGIWPAL